MVMLTAEHSRDEAQLLTDEADAQMDAYLQQVKEKQETDQHCSSDIQVEEEVFKRSFIPRTLEDVINVEKEVNLVQQFGTKDVFYNAVAGVCVREVPTQTVENVINHVTHLKVEASSEIEKEEISSTSDESISEKNGTEDDNSDGDTESEEKVTKQMNKEFRKEHKKAVKEANREKRQTKTPKAVKKRKIKVSKQRKPK